MVFGRADRCDGYHKDEHNDKHSKTIKGSHLRRRRP